MLTLKILCSPFPVTSHQSFRILKLLKFSEIDIIATVESEERKTKAEANFWWDRFLNRYDSIVDSERKMKDAVVHLEETEQWWINLAFLWVLLVKSLLLLISAQQMMTIRPSDGFLAYYFAFASELKILLKIMKFAVIWTEAERTKYEFMSEIVFS